MSYLQITIVAHAHFSFNSFDSNNVKIYKAPNIVITSSAVAEILMYGTLGVAVDLQRQSIDQTGWLPPCRSSSLQTWCVTAGGRHDAD